MDEDKHKKFLIKYIKLMEDHILLKYDIETIIKENSELKTIINRLINELLNSIDD